MRRLLAAVALLLAPSVALAQFGGGGFGAGTSLPRIQLAGTEQRGVNVLNFSTNISGSLSAGTLTLSIAAGAGLTASTPLEFSAGNLKFANSTKGSIAWADSATTWGVLAPTSSALLQVSGAGVLAWQTSPAVTGTFTAGALTANGGDINAEPPGDNTPSALLTIKSLADSVPQDWALQVTPGTFGTLDLLYNGTSALTIEPPYLGAQRIASGGAATLVLESAQATLTSPAVRLKATSDYGATQYPFIFTDATGDLVKIRGDGDLQVATNVTFAAGIPHTVAPTTPAAAGATGDALTARGGNGANGSGATPGGAGGSTTIDGATGGEGSASAAAGAGGATVITGGNAGVDNGGGGADGGAATLRGGRKSSAGTDGAVTIGDINTSAIAVGASGIITTFSGPIAASATGWNIADPGNGGAIPVTHSGVVNLTSGGAGHTRTVAAPTFEGQWLMVSHDVDGGDVALTFSGGDFDQGGNNVWTTDTAGEYGYFIARRVGGSLRWAILENAGGALSFLFLDLAPSSLAA